MMAGVTRFQRLPAGNWEWGIAVSHVNNLSGEVDVIIDVEGKVVDKLHKWHDSSSLGCFMMVLMQDPK